jgi:hypothetical protein
VEVHEINEEKVEILSSKCIIMCLFEQQKKEKPRALSYSH